MGTEQLAVSKISSTCMPTILYCIILYLYCMYCMYLNPTHRVANKLVSLSQVSARGRLVKMRMCSAVDKSSKINDKINICALAPAG